MDLATKVQQGLDNVNNQVQMKFNEQGELIATLSDQVQALEQQSGGIRTIPTAGLGSSFGLTKTKAEFNDFLKTGDKSVFSAQNSASISDGGSGGYTMVPHLSDTIIDAVNGFNPLLSDVGMTETYSQQYEQLFTTTGSVASRAAESNARNLGGDPRMDKVVYDLSYMYSVPSVTEELFNSSSFDLAGYVEGEVLKGFSNALTSEVLNGDTASQQCGGIYQATSTYEKDDIRAFGTLQSVKSGVDGNLDYDGVVSLIQSLAPRYRAKAKIYSSTEGIEVLRTIKDSAGNPLWRDCVGGITNAAQSFLGYEVVEIPEMEAIATGSKPMIFANLEEGYKVVTHKTKVQADVDMTSTLGIIKFYIRQMIGGGIADSNAIKILELSA